MKTKYVVRIKLDIKKKKKNYYCNNTKYGHYFLINFTLFSLLIIEHINVCSIKKGNHK
jgi:hypothetical protein